MQTKQTIWKKLFSGSGWALFTMFVWELVEEGIENLIAYMISSAVALFITKALSTLFIITATQGIKVACKRFLVPVVREFTYKEGNDKTDWIKRGLRFLMKNIKNNPMTIIYMLLFGGVFGYMGFVYSGLADLAMYARILIGVGVAVVVAVMIWFLGWDKVKQAFMRAASKNLSEENYKKVESLIVELENLQLEEKLKTKAEAEAKAKALTEAMAELKQKQQAELDELVKQKLEQVKSQDAEPAIETVEVQ